MSNKYYTILLLIIISLVATSCAPGVKIYQEAPLEKPIEPETVADSTTTPEAPAEVIVDSVEASTPPPIEPPDSVSVEAEAIDTRLRMIFAGDIMPGTDFPSVEYLPPDGGRNMLHPEVENIIRSADIAFGNLEGVICTGGYAWKGRNSYSFRIPPALAERFWDWGFDAFSIANNHARDFGEEGKYQTRRKLGEMGIRYAGYGNYSSTVLTRNGLTIGFIAFAPFKSCNSPLDIPLAGEMVSELSENTDITVVSMHIGSEGADKTHVRNKTEYYRHENRGNPVRFARAMIDAGADVVFGHGPHVPRAVELYKDRFIAYSLGNFLTWSRFSLTGVKGYAPLLEVTTDDNGKFIEGQFHSVIQFTKQVRESDPELRAFKLIRKLTNEDFPNHKLIFGEDGSIKPKD
ncbi:MAG: CapA family protein [Candidatus Cloacimonetes bacterium]|nr:CapA family protein [Candidatus Cloacimonadota bacterium]